jgi:hypothetical protein
MQFISRLNQMIPFMFDHIITISHFFEDKKMDEIDAYQNKSMLDEKSDAIFAFKCTTVEDPENFEGKMLALTVRADIIDSGIVIVARLCFFAMIGETGLIIFVDPIFRFGAHASNTAVRGTNLQALYMKHYLSQYCDALADTEKELIKRPKIMEILDDHCPVVSVAKIICDYCQVHSRFLDASIRANLERVSKEKKTTEEVLAKSHIKLEIDPAYDIVFSMLCN